MRRYVLCTAPSEQSPEQFMAYVNSLYQPPDVAPDSKSAKGIKIHKQESGTVIIRCTRDEKELQLEEVKALAVEYSLDYESLRDMFYSRKFKLFDQQGERYVKPRRHNGRKRKPASEADAHLDDNADRALRANQLFVSGSDSDVPQESPLQPEPEP